MKYHDLEPTVTEIAEIEERKAEAHLEKRDWSLATGRDTKPGHRGRAPSEGPTPRQEKILTAAYRVVDARGYVKYSDLRRELNNSVPDLVGLITYMKKLGRWPFKTYGRSRRK